jgi:polyferredoxin
MDKMGYARGLIRFTTQNAMESAWGRREIWKRVMRPRVLVYAVVLATLCFALALSLAMRTPLKVDVVRDRTSLARIVEGGRLENVYRLQVMNATEQEQHYRLEAEGLPGLEIASERDFSVGPAQSRWIAVRLRVPYGAAEPGSHPIHFEVEAKEGAAHVREKSAFLVPR